VVTVKCQIRQPLKPVLEHLPSLELKSALKSGYIDSKPVDIVKGAFCTRGIVRSSEADNYYGRLFGCVMPRMFNR
jgi:hypothetical protein